MATTGTAAAATVHLVAMPYPGRGHVNPMMNLCELLLSSSPNSSSLCMKITFVVTEEWLGFLSDQYITNPSIELRSIPNVIPSELNRGADAVGFLEAVLTKMESPVEHLLSQLVPPPAAIVADSYGPWAVSIGNRRGIPVYSLFPMSPSVFSVFYHYDMILADAEPSGQWKEISELVPGVTFRHLSNFGPDFTSQKIMEVVMTCFSELRNAQGLLFNTFDDLEPNVMNTLRATLPFPVYTVGPCIPFARLEDSSNGGNHGDYFGWLDSQKADSVLYVSLGSFVQVSGAQMEELALGLHDSGVRFLWVARGKSSRLIELSGGMGMVLPWCDQLRVLSHLAVGGFLTHGGWNSTLESVFAGKPMVVFPLCADQLSNSWVIANDWNIGVKVRENLCIREGKVGGVVGREEIARAVRLVMDLDGEASKDMRRRAGLLKEKCHSAIGDGGSSTTNLHSFIDAVMRGFKE